MGAGRAALEGAQRFGTVNVIVGAVSILTYASAAAGASIHLSLPALAGLLVIVRALAVVALVTTLAQTTVGVGFARPSQYAMRRLLHFGRWIVVGSVTGPLVVFGDRFIVSSVLGV